MIPNSYKKIFKNIGLEIHNSYRKIPSFILVSKTKNNLLRIILHEILKLITKIVVMKQGLNISKMKLLEKLDNTHG